MLQRKDPGKVGGYAEGIFMGVVTVQENFQPAESQALKVKLEYTLPKTNSELFAPEIVFQPSIFRCYC